MRIIIKSCLLCLLCFSDVAQASLGGVETSIEVDRRNMSALRHESKDLNAYTVHEIANQSLVIREYVSSDRVIFAIAWSGERHPDLTGLMGKYFSDYKLTSQNSVKIKGAHSHGVVDAKSVIVEKSGHMRWVQGKAYVPALMPKGVSANEIQ